MHERERKRKRRSNCEKRKEETIYCIETQQIIISSFIRMNIRETARENSQGERGREERKKTNGRNDSLFFLELVFGGAPEITNAKIQLDTSQEHCYYYKSTEQKVKRELRFYQ